jgi:uncharacterized protein with HEPN domain
MRDTAREAVTLAQSQTIDDLAKNRVLNLALTRLLEILGEAATRFPVDIREKHPRLPWPQIIGLRNRLIHAYDQADLEILWEIVAEDLPPLTERLNRIIQNWDYGF